ncbi:MAG: hypothetical protein CVU97_00750 [Firmicutes bacterium HGW-Firmicutes-21]|nr:MAG: hypothetical protein CVU97_00750 [Firmicutes bacterium HGW-Firmicutes-21]
MIPVLQSRWAVRDKYLIYYGLRKQPDTFKSKIKISSRTAAFIKSLDGTRTLEDYTEHKITFAIKRLIKQKIIIDVTDKSIIPSSFDDASFCVRCPANNFVIPGLELNSEGLCPICTTFPSIKNLGSVLPVKNIIPPTPTARFDVALFYTGGKDSSYLLYYLSRVLGLRVMALTWKHPYMSDNALKSIANAKELLPEVTFVVREASPTALKKIYSKCYELQENTCICPSVAYVLFFPLLLENPVPYLVLGNEPAQSKALILNRLVPKILYRPTVKKALRLAVNIGRVFMLRKTFREGQLEMYITVKNLAFRKNSILKKLGYKNEVMDNLVASLAEAGEMLIPLQYAVQKSKKGGDIPALVHIDFDELSETGSYDWRSIKRLLTSELGWVDSAQEDKGLHTSCGIERCKEYSQLTRFREMKSGIIPFSALELSLAVLQGSLTREQAIDEMKKHCGFSEFPKKENRIMTDFFK